jgi:hypothetical protein
MGCKRIALFSAKVDHLLLCCEEESCFGPKGYSLTKSLQEAEDGWWYQTTMSSFQFVLWKVSRHFLTVPNLVLSRLTCSCVARLHESTFSVWCKEGVFWSRESPDEEKDLWIPPGLLLSHKLMPYCTYCKRDDFVCCCLDTLLLSRHVHSCSSGVKLVRSSPSDSQSLFKQTKPGCSIQAFRLVPVSPFPGHAALLPNQLSASYFSGKCHGESKYSEGWRIAMRESSTPFLLWFSSIVPYLFHDKFGYHNILSSSKSASPVSWLRYRIAMTDCVENDWHLWKVLIQLHSILGLSCCHRKAFDSVALWLDVCYKSCLVCYMYPPCLGMMTQVNSQFEKTQKVSGPRSLRPSVRNAVSRWYYWGRRVWLGKELVVAGAHYNRRRTDEEQRPLNVCARTLGSKTFVIYKGQRNKLDWFVPRFFGQILAFIHDRISL